MLPHMGGGVTEGGYRATAIGGTPVPPIAPYPYVRADCRRYIIYYA